jgi:hypothetical protein
LPRPNEIWTLPFGNSMVSTSTRVDSSRITSFCSSRSVIVPPASALAICSLSDARRLARELISVTAPRRRWSVSSCACWNRPSVARISPVSAWPRASTSARAVLDVGAWASAPKLSNNWLRRTFSVEFGVPSVDSTTPSVSASAVSRWWAGFSWNSRRSRKRSRRRRTPSTSTPPPALSRSLVGGTAPRSTTRRAYPGVLMLAMFWPAASRP